jgi:hypothetical protein
VFDIFRRRANPRFPILTYHSLNAPGLTYGTNDHLALEEDLSVVRACGFHVVPVRRIVDAVLGHVPPPRGKCVGITFDDGVNFDYWTDVYRISRISTGKSPVLKRAASMSRCRAIAGDCLGSPAVSTGSLRMSWPVFFRLRPSPWRSCISWTARKRPRASFPASGCHGTRLPSHVFRSGAELPQPRSPPPKRRKQQNPEYPNDDDPQPESRTAPARAGVARRRMERPLDRVIR